MSTTAARTAGITVTRPYHQRGARALNAAADAQAALGRYDDGNERSLGVAQVEMTAALVEAVLDVADVLDTIARRLEVRA